jgi:hypothetical protein
MKGKTYIDKALPDDIPSLESIAQKCFPDGSQNIDISDSKPQILVIRDIEKGVAGYIIYSDEEKNISGMAVLPEYCCDENGSSKKLLDSMTKHIALEGGEWEAYLRDSTSLVYLLMQAKRGIAKITEFDDLRFFTMSNGDNVYYAKFAYVPVARRRWVREENEESIKMMEKVINVNAENEQTKKENEKKLADLFVDISNAFKETGNSFEISKNRIVFRIKEDEFFIYFNKKSLDHFGISCHIYSFEEQDKYDILKFTNDFNCELDDSWIMITYNHCYACMRMETNLHETPSDVVNDIIRTCDMMLSTSYDFRARLKRLGGISPPTKLNQILSSAINQLFQKV